MHDIIEEATQVDRSGAAVLEFILHCDGNSLPGFTTIQLKELTVVAWLVPLVD